MFLHVANVKSLGSWELLRLKSSTYLVIGQCFSELVSDAVFFEYDFCTARIPKLGTKEGIARQYQVEGEQ